LSLQTAVGFFHPKETIMIDSFLRIRPVQFLSNSHFYYSNWVRFCSLIIVPILAWSFGLSGAALAKSPEAPGKIVEIAAKDCKEAPANLQAISDNAGNRTFRQKELTFPARLGRLIGKFHVLAVHFPIALSLEAVLVELLSMWRKEQTPSSVVRLLVLLGAAGAVSTAGLGWLHAAFAAAGPRQILFIHRWLGTLAAIWSVGTLALSELDARSTRRSNRFRLALFLGAGLISLAGHFGGTLVFGQDYFKW
jgi:uncharacterized membrane protein